MKKIALTGFISMLSAITVISVYALYFDNNKSINNGSQLTQNQPITLAGYELIESGKIAPVDFTFAAGVSTPAVVHVKKTFTNTRSNSRDPFRDFFGDDFSPFGYGQPKSPQQQIASGSGVIISDNGYIVTNNHVVSDADKIEVTLFDKRSYVAELIGVDPSTDLALIKIEANNLPIIPFGDSDSALVGEWVLAVGNPFDLTSTVTAGIISAKGRNINILREQSRAPIESFIQTDAAVNPGNSGGALINTKGELLGINTAIATPTGTYAGYSFAVPVNIAKKVVADLMDYGIVQRAYLGVSIRDIDSELAKEIGLNRIQGVYVASVQEGTGAEEAGLKDGDIITAVNQVKVGSVSELQEQVSKYRPGDKLAISFIRKGNEKTSYVTLKNGQNTTSIIEKETIDFVQLLGAEFEELNTTEKKDYGVTGGVKVKALLNGKLKNATSIYEGFVITRVDHQKIESVKDLNEQISKKKKGDGVLIEGFYPKAPYKTYYYAFGM